MISTSSNMNRRRTKLTTLAGLAFALCAACSSTGGLPEEARLAAPPQLATGYAVNSQIGMVVAEARFVENPERTFGDDPVEEYGVVPISVRIGLRGQNAAHEGVYIDPAKMDFRLYLEDGTALAQIPASEVAPDDSDLSRALAKLELKAGDLMLLDDPDNKAAWIYFRLPERRAFAMADEQIEHRSGSVTRTLAIERSLLRFRIVRATATPLTFYLGLGRR